MGAGQHKISGITIEISGGGQGLSEGPDGETVRLIDGLEAPTKKGFHDGQGENDLSN